MAQLSEFDNQHLGDIFAGQGDWMSAQIMRLIAKSDPVTREQFRAGFPDHVAAYEAFMANGDNT